MKLGHLKRYRDIARLLVRYGRGDLVRQAGLEEVPDERDQARDTPAVELAERLAKDLEALGPTYIKIGQLLSTRADLLPGPFLDALSRLQDDVASFPYAQVEQIVTTELGVRISKAFATFEREPLAAASLGQVHRATMRDGRQVVVKVQRPLIREQIVTDLEALGEIAEFADKHTEAGRKYGYALIVDEFRKSLLKELDYRLEARNQATLRQNLKAFEHIVVPDVIEDYSTALVLTSEFVPGVKVTEIGPLGQMDIDGAMLADELFRAYLQQILVDGFVHADPHPGNVLLTEDGRVALLDLGMVTRISPGLQEKLLQLVMAISEGHGDEAATIALKIGEERPDADEALFRRQVSEMVAENRDSKMEQIHVGKVVLAITRTSGDCGFRVPPEMTMLGKALLNLDEVGRTLDAKFDPNATIRRRSAELTQRRMRQSFSAGNVFGTLIETKDFVERLPARANKILDLVADNRLSLKVDALDEELLLEGFQKVANRITVGLVLAALIVGAAMLMRIETAWKILGYPGLAMLFFISAAGAGLWLTLQIMLTDSQTRKKARPRTTK
ncbi:MAG: AarF/UbiB family protein [Vicinamibacteria bacterium]|nr:AarF/UbiB family protein [Vicinamibacteria bacterium]